MEQQTPVQAVPEPTEPTVQVIPNSRKLVLSFRRTVQPKQYESASMEASVEVELPPGASIDDASNVFDVESAVLKAHVFSQLGLSYTLSEGDDGVRRVMEVFGPEGAVPTSNPAPVNPVANTVFAPPPGQPAAPAAAPFPAAGAAPAVAPGGADPAETTWRQIAADFHSGNANNWWDNRADLITSPRRPAFKHKKNGDLAVWKNTCPADLLPSFFPNG